MKDLSPRVFEKNLDKAIVLYEESAEQGYDIAMLFLARLYISSEEKYHDTQKVIYWSCKGAIAGNSECQFNLSSFYRYGWVDHPNHKILFGNNFKKSHSKSMLWLHKSGKNGYAKAQFNLGVHYSDSKYRDPIKSEYWFKLANKYGFTRADMLKPLRNIQDRSDLFSKVKSPEQQNH